MKDKKQVIINLPRDQDFKRDLKLMATYQGYDSSKALMEDIITKSLENWRKENKPEALKTK
jgi:hypothetical protein